MDSEAISNLQTKFSDCSTAETLEEENKGIRVVSMEKENESIRVKPLDNMDKEKKERQQQAANLKFNSELEQASKSIDRLGHTSTQRPPKWSSLSTQRYRANRAQAPLSFSQLYVQDDAKAYKWDVRLNKEQFFERREEAHRMHRREMGETRKDAKKGERIKLILSSQGNQHRYQPDAIVRSVQLWLTSIQLEGTIKFDRNDVLVGALTPTGPYVIDLDKGYAEDLLEEAQI